MNRGVGRRRLAVDLALLAVIGMLLVAAVAAAGAVLYQRFYGPAAFVERYLGMLADGRAADALAVPGVAIDSRELEAAGLPAVASDALLRSAVLAPLTEVQTVEESDDGGISRIRVSYTAGGYEGATTFQVERAGWIGVAPAWRFAKSPLAVLDLSVTGSMQFAVNGFEIDKRQVSVDGVDADPAAAVPLLVFSPGVYRVAVDTPVATATGPTVLSDAPMKNVPVTVAAEPTAQFVSVVQDRVNGFLASCATQQVLQPTGCPFGFRVQNRIEAPPVWSIVEQPTIAVEPDGANWAIPAAPGVAHIEVDIRSLYDGSIRHVRQDVPFTVTGTITIQVDGSAAISIGGEARAD